jgi:hypothetical protein
MEFADFLKALQIQKKREKSKGAEQDIIDAFVAMGGQPDKSGFINAEALRKVRFEALSFAIFRSLDPFVLTSIPPSSIFSHMSLLNTLSYFISVPHAHPNVFSNR